MIEFLSFLFSTICKYERMRFLFYFMGRFSHSHHIDVPTQLEKLESREEYKQAKIIIIIYLFFCFVLFITLLYLFIVTFVYIFFDLYSFLKDLNL